MITHDKAQQIVDSYLNALAATDLKGVLALYSENATVEDPVGTDPIQGQQALSEFYERAVGWVYEAKRIGEVRCANNEVVFAFEVKSEVEGNRFAIEVIDHFIFDEQGKIKSMRAFWSDTNMRLLEAAA